MVGDWIQDLRNSFQTYVVMNDIINNIDVSKYYFLVTFWDKDDQYQVLMDGPWLIYDCYLSIIERSPNFHSDSDQIEKVVIWVRFLG